MGVPGGRWRDKDKYDPGYNLGPGSILPVVYCSPPRSDAPTQDSSQCTREMASMKWGLIPFWSQAGDARRFKTSNARAETLAHKRSYKGLIPRQRCVVVVEGFYEWAVSNPSPGITLKQPYFFQRPDRRLLALAGLYDCWKDPQGGNEVWTFTMITTAAAPNIEWCHDRMPVILDESDIDIWLRTDMYPPEVALKLLKPDTGLEWYAVPSLVNFTGKNSPECIQRVELRNNKRGVSPSSSPQRQLQPRSPASKQPKIESFVKRESGGRGDESGVKMEPSSPSSSLHSLPPPASPYRKPDQRIYPQYSASSASSSSVSSLASPAVTASPSSSRSPDPASSSATSPSSAKTVVQNGAPHPKRKRDDDGAERKAEESVRDSKVVKTEDDDEEEQRTSECTQNNGRNTEGGSATDNVLNDEQQTTAGEPWDEDSFPYYLVDDPTISSSSAAEAGNDPEIVEVGSGRGDDDATALGQLSPGF